MEQTTRWSPVKRAVSCFAAATLVVSLTPSAALYGTAYADEPAAQMAQSQVAAQEAETMVSTWLQADGTTSRGSTGNFDSNVKVEQLEKGYQLDIAFTGKKVLTLDKFRYDDAVDAEVIDETEDTVVYRIVADSIDGAIPVTYGYTVTYGGSEHVMSHDVYLVVAPDAESLATKQANVANELALSKIEAGKDYVAPVTWKSPVDGHDTTTAMSPATINNKVGVVKLEDGAFAITLRPTDAIITGFEYPVGTPVAANEDGTTTISVDSLTEGIRILTNITTPMGAHPQDQIMTIGLTGLTAGSILDETGAVDKTNLTGAIEQAKAIEQGTKSAEAFAELQEAIATAQAIADDEAATVTDVHAGFQALKAAIEAFNASEDESDPSDPTDPSDPSDPSDPGATTSDELYRAPLSVLKADSDEESMAAKFLEPAVNIVKESEEAYRVILTANEAGVEQNIKLYTADGEEIPRVSADEPSFTFTVNDLGEPVSVLFGADGMGDNRPSARLSIDESSQALGMQRLYNPNSGEHFYTNSIKEHDTLVQAGWNDEGIAWGAPIEGGDPVYRLYNPNAGEHHYTVKQDERDYLTQNDWELEGTGWLSASDDKVPLYRLYNPNEPANNHHYTTDEVERDSLVDLGWDDEGVGWYAVMK